MEFVEFRNFLRIGFVSHTSCWLYPFLPQLVDEHNLQAYSLLFLGVSVSLSSWSYCSWLQFEYIPPVLATPTVSTGYVQWHFNLLWWIHPLVTRYDLFFSLVWFLGLLQLIWYAFNSFSMDILGFNSLIVQTTKWLHAIWDCMRKKSILSTVFGHFLAQTAKN